MLRIKYRGYTIAQQREFGPLRLLQWVENGNFIVVKDDRDAIPGASFQSPEDAKRAVDLHLEYTDNLRKLSGS